MLKGHLQNDKDLTYNYITLAATSMKNKHNVKCDTTYEIHVKVCSTDDRSTMKAVDFKKILN